MISLSTRCVSVTSTVSILLLSYVTENSSKVLRVSFSMKQFASRFSSCDTESFFLVIYFVCTTLFQMYHRGFGTIRTSRTISRFLSNWIRALCMKIMQTCVTSPEWLNYPFVSVILYVLLCIIKEGHWPAKPAEQIVTWSAWVLYMFSFTRSIQKKVRSIRKLKGVDESSVYIDDFNY